MQYNNNNKNHYPVRSCFRNIFLFYIHNFYFISKSIVTNTKYIKTCRGNVNAVLLTNFLSSKSIIISLNYKYANSKNKAISPFYF